MPCYDVAATCVLGEKVVGHWPPDLRLRTLSPTCSDINNPCMATNFSTRFTQATLDRLRCALLSHFCCKPLSDVIDVDARCSRIYAVGLYLRYPQWCSCEISSGHTPMASAIGGS